MFEVRQFGGGIQSSFSPGRSSQRHSAGRKMIAAIMLTTNMKVSMTPMSAWNFSAENTQVADADRERQRGVEDRDAGGLERGEVRLAAASCPASCASAMRAKM